MEQPPHIPSRDFFLSLSGVWAVVYMKGIYSLWGWFACWGTLYSRLETQKKELLTFAEPSSEDPSGNIFEGFTSLEAFPRLCTVLC